VAVLPDLPEPDIGEVDAETDRVGLGRLGHEPAAVIGGAGRVVVVYTGPCMESPKAISRVPRPVMTNSACPAVCPAVMRTCTPGKISWPSVTVRTRGARAARASLEVPPASSCARWAHSGSATRYSARAKRGP